MKIYKCMIGCILCLLLGLAIGAQATEEEPDYWSSRMMGNYQLAKEFLQGNTITCSPDKKFILNYKGKATAITMEDICKVLLEKI